ncbi:phosphatidylethanolamine N-methyltransferase isoform X3 [Neoarius graeffei]|uniref:phosphatidylethanolamine N-methyltransferase isoform X3 n=1 Tax=Neoarius graeffei TaxID=443677 RepID=UPI00298CDE03|nr:phosphatidylethanolamine N-methyltransferase isoform X3 [Neoarius graeffei]
MNSAAITAINPDCCGGFDKVDFSKADMSVLHEVTKHIDLKEPSFCIAVISIMFNPFFWNVVARWEHRTRGLTRMFKSPYVACYCLGAVILLLNVYRSHSITVAMKSQPKMELLDRVQVYYMGTALMLVGSLFVISSFLALGFTGTFLDRWIEQKAGGSFVPNGGGGSMPHAVHQPQALHAGDEVQHHQ